MARGNKSAGQQGRRAKITSQGVQAGGARHPQAMRIPVAHTAGAAETGTAVGAAGAGEEALPCRRQGIDRSARRSWLLQRLCRSLSGCARRWKMTSRLTDAVLYRCSRWGAAAHETDDPRQPVQLSKQVITIARFGQLLLLPQCCSTALLPASKCCGHLPSSVGGAVAVRTKLRIYQPFFNVLFHSRMLLSLEFPRIVASGIAPCSAYSRHPLSSTAARPPGFVATGAAPSITLALPQRCRQTPHALLQVPDAAVRPRHPQVGALEVRVTPPRVADAACATDKTESLSCGQTEERR